MSKAPFRPDYLRTLVKQHAINIRSFGGMCLEKCDHRGFKAIGAGLPPAKQELLQSEVSRCLQQYKQSWTLILFVFYVRHGEPDVIVREIEVTNVKNEELNIRSTYEIDKLWDSVDKEERVSSAWVAIPVTGISFVDEYDTWINYFGAKGAWDKEHCLTVRTLRGLEGEHYRGELELSPVEIDKLCKDLQG